MVLYLLPLVTMCVCYLICVMCPPPTKIVDSPLYILFIYIYLSIPSPSAELILLLPLLGI